VESFLISLAAVAFAEIGDKTQLLALVLAARYRRTLPICLGIFVATLFNHALAGEAGVLVANLISPAMLHWILGLSFISVAIWALFPDKLDKEEAQRASHYGVFMATTIGFFLAEMGDRTQVATAMLAAHYQPLWQVIAGTTVGMLAANVPVVIFGSRFAHRLPLRATRLVAAVLFAALGILILLRN